MGYVEWEVYLRKTFADHPKKLLAGVLSEKLPRRLVDVLIDTQWKYIAEKFVGTLSRQDRESIA